MRLRPVGLEGVHLLVPDRHADERGYFARIFDADLLGEAGLDTRIVQSSISENLRAGTLRGMHWQAGSHGEVKYVRCTKGAIYDVVVDLRPASATYLRWTSVELSEENDLTLYIPKGCAHGFQTLRDRSQIQYQMTEPFVPEAGRGLRYDDRAIGIVWPPTATRTLSEKDRSYPDFVP